MAEGMKQIKDVTLTYAATGAAGSFVVNADPPTGGSYTAALATTTGRITRTMDIESQGDLFGKLVQFQATPGVGGVLQLFSGKIRFRTIGLYLASGEIWKSQPMTLGSS